MSKFQQTPVKKGIVEHKGTKFSRDEDRLTEFSRFQKLFDRRTVSRSVEDNRRTISSSKVYRAVKSSKIADMG